MKFSDRIGVTKSNRIIQENSMDESLRNHLWNALNIYYWSQSNSKYMVDSDFYGCLISNKISPLLQKIWHSYLNQRIDTMSNLINDNIEIILNKFYKFKWYEVYNFIEFLVKIDDNEYRKDEFIDFCNQTFENDRAGYRFVNREITPITSEVEIETIESAYRNTERYSNVNRHLKQAQNLFSKRPDPDYRNSIKESISAVEAMCCIVCGKENATLGEAINLMKRQGFPLHQAFANALSNLYGYTSDSNGIRHHLHEVEYLCSADAKFMLVICSAFVNYIIEIKSMKKNN